MLEKTFIELIGNIEHRGMGDDYHNEMKKVAEELLKSLGYQDSEIKKEYKTEKYIFDVVAIRHTELQKIIEVGELNPEKLKFCLKEYKEKFLWLPYARHDYILLQHNNESFLQIINQFKRAIKEQRR